MRTPRYNRLWSRIVFSSAAVVIFSCIPSMASVAPLFLNAPTYAVGNSPVSIAAGDFNHDGIPDLAVANASQGTYLHGTVSVLLGTGNGSFLPAVNYNIANDVVFWVVTADFNGDGNLDLVVAHDASLDILLGKGDGTFGAPTPCYGHYANQVFIGDFNGDHKLDLVVLTNDSVLLLLGNGDGTFQPPSTITSSSHGVHTAIVADFNGDGRQDLAVALEGLTSPELDLLLGNGDGTFRQGAVYGTRFGILSMTAADFNADGISDIAVTGSSSQGFFTYSTIGIFLGNGDGTFRALKDFDNGFDTPAGMLVAGDFNNDGKPDLGLVNTGSDTVSVLLGNGDGTFAAGSDWAVGPFPVALAAADFNLDGKLDLVATNEVENSVSVLLGNGNGKFQAAPAASVGFDPVVVAAADFNGDGKADLAVVNLSSGSLGILLGNGDATFKPAVNYNAPQVFPDSVVLGDFNGDHILDIAMLGQCPKYNCLNDTVSVFLGNGDGTFRLASSFNAGGSIPYFNIAAGDFNGDGYDDLLVAHQFPSQLLGTSLLISNGDGTFQKPVTLYQSFFGGGASAVGDFNRDGKLDFVTTANNNLVVFIGNGDGTFQPNFYPLTVIPSNLAVADFNHDGYLDLVGLDIDAGTVSVLLGNGDGTFSTEQEFYTGSKTTGNPWSLTIADFNHDGNPDVAVANQASIFENPGNVAVILGNGDGTFGPPSLYSSGSPVWLTSADFNGDGLPDIATANGNGNNVILLINTGK